MKNEYKKIVAVLLILAFFVSPIAASRAHAQWVDWAQLAKEYGLDTVGWFIINTIIERMSASTINWINTGFQGKPAYLIDSDEYFKNLADGVAGQIIYKHPDLKFMCSPFKAQVQIALTKTYVDEPSFQCTLGEVANNWENFMDDFSQGGWEGFINVTQSSQNNPIGLYMGRQNELVQKIQDEANKKTQELDWGQGFLSYETCDHYGNDTVKTVVEGGKFELQPDGANKYVKGTTKTITEKNCLRKSTKTPGSVINDRLNDALASPSGRLEAADELNEIISALLNQVVSKALTGLLSLSKPGSGESKKTAPTNGQCPTGFILSGNECISNTPTFTDQLGSNSIGASVTPVDGMCPEGFTLVSEDECASTKSVSGMRDSSVEILEQGKNNWDRNEAILNNQYANLPPDTSGAGGSQDSQLEP